MLPNWYIKRKDFIEDEIKFYIENKIENSKIKALKDFKEAIFYACEWWKKIRAIFALEFYLTLKNISFEVFLSEKEKHLDIIKFAIGLEFIHAYSLVHDDLPCMDNDILRRWKPTVWKKYWEWQATLVWDKLNTFTFQILSEIRDSVLSVKLTNLISRATWLEGMIWWQVMDIYFEENPKEMSIKKLIKLHNKKTWALIKASIQWAILVSGKLEFLHSFSSFWEKLGLAFQIKDDILDVEWTKEETGKSVWWEEKWFVYFLWIKKSKEKLKILLDDCFLSIKILKSKNINFLVDFVGNRGK